MSYRVNQIKIIPEKLMQLLNNSWNRKLRAANERFYRSVALFNLKTLKVP